ncbi:bestrophin family protein [Reichenbachiella ulvae]|uniref:Bestrophin, RFP-TM, chloride channel n=1 Tax=Reichenbachiella ulvae TaxID=2980104 RepID=A0ABT3CQK3_9BACT|nr:bestrophin family ion channel [Reichenbachiella ulvae]MCV9385983.1 hypothetical protein [Reichenbachiella ulvae]
MIIKSRIPVSYLFNELKIPLLYVCLIASISGLLPFFFQSFLSDIPISIATTLGIAISILLSYMMNQSYERWWEARKIWGEIVNDSRTLVIQLKMYLNANTANIEALSYRQIAWNHCLGRHLRKTRSIEDLQKWFSEEEYKDIKEKGNIPLAILSLQSSTIAKLYHNNELDKFSQIQIEETIARLTASMGKCERIKNTIFPPIYRYGLHSSIYLFVIFLSLSVAFKLQHFALEFSILVIVSIVFFFLEKAAFRMQDPFENIPTDTPVTFIAEKIESDILEMLGKENNASPQTSSRQFYVL